MITGYERPLAAHDAAPGARLLRGLPLAGASTTTTRCARRSTTTPTRRTPRCARRLIVHTGSGEAREKATRGIHWHIDAERRVRDATTRRSARSRWVRITGKDGKYDDLLRRVEQGRPRRDGPEAEAADGLHRLPQRRRPSVHESRGPRRRGDLGGPHRPQHLPSIKARAVAIIEKASTLHGPDGGAGRRSSRRSSPTPRPRAS